MVNPIMTQTLPTIVATGVVSRTTETMFGRGRRIRGRSKRTVKSRLKSARPKPMPKIHKGSRGGKYLVRRGRKIYI